ncbi:MAG: exodeoxyribonuclease VII small subunit [bacterium]
MSEPAPLSSRDDVAAGSDDVAAGSDDVAAGSAGVQPTPSSYEAARAELAEVMRALESGGQSLEESLELWKRGEALADLCQRWLDAASARLEDAIAARKDRSDE